MLTSSDSFSIQNSVFPSMKHSRDQPRNSVTITASLALFYVNYLQWLPVRL